MAELDNLTLKFTFNDKEFRDLEKQGVRTAEVLNTSYSELDSMFVLLSNDVSEFQQALERLNNTKFTLNGPLIEIAKTIGESYDLSVQFGESYEEVIEKLNNVKPIIEATNDSLNKTSSKFPDFRPLVSLLTEVAKFYRSSETFIKIFINFFDAFKVFTEHYVREFLSKIPQVFNLIVNVLRSGFDEFINFLNQAKVAGSANYQRLLEFLARAKDFSRIQFGNFTKFASELGGKAVQGLRSFFQTLSRNYRTIATFLGSLGLMEIALTELGFLLGGLASLTLPEIVLLGTVLGVTYLAVTGQLDDFGRKAEEVFKNHVLPLFQNANEGAEGLKEGINNVGDALEGLEVPSEEAVPKSDPQLKLFLEPLDPKQLEELKKQIERQEEFRRQENKETLEQIKKNAEEQVGIYQDVTEKQSEFSQVSVEETKDNFSSLVTGIKQGAKDLATSLFSLPEAAAAETTEEIDKTVERLKDQEPVVLPTIVVTADPIIDEQIEGAQEKIDNLGGAIGEVQNKAQAFDQTIAEGVVNLKGYGEAAQTAADGGVTNLEGKVEDLNEAASNLNLVEAVEELTGIGSNIALPGFVKSLIESKKEVKEIGDTFKETSERAQVSLNALGVFAADVAAEINNTFSEFIFRSFKGDFDNLSDLWKSMLDTMLKAFAQFISTVISNPIRIGLETFLSGGGGGGSGLFSSLTGLGGTLGLGSSGLFGASGSFTALTNLFGAGAGGSEGMGNTAVDEDGAVIGLFNKEAEVGEVGYRMAA